MKRRYIMALCAILGGMCIPSSRADIDWSIVDEEWVPITIGTNYYNDLLGDQSPTAIDLIGTVDSYSAGYWAFVEGGDIVGTTTNDAFMFRMRVGGNGGNYVWQAHLNTDTNVSNVEYIFEVVQSGNPADQSVQLNATENGGPTLGDISVAKKAAPLWSGSLAGYSQWTPVAGSSDYYVDFAIPWTSMTNIAGITQLEQIQAVLATSSTHAGINKDAPLGGDLSQMVSDSLSNSIPEPAVATFIILFGTAIIGIRRIFK